MSQSNPASRPTIWNVPNQATAARLALTVALFVCHDIAWYGSALALFLVAAGTDWFDGFWARRYGQVTQLGRILDPFADKLIICGSFAYLAASPQDATGHPLSRVSAWLAVLILARELAVTALRSFVEQSGGDFSAKWAGKWKMVFQCAAVALSIGRLWALAPGSASQAPFAWNQTWEGGLSAALALTVALTVYSAVGYVFAAARMLRETP
ncbi:MAG: CDP-diacylglycerol--glycerol-3-phosphate 3-phosphatidyltransferase [Planctomycetales bacterium]|nr:CDP-diacylglycerol--glycerol-3-phosphate 3-phosphatidyltransferase [Planctomycetales bacterium]